MRWFAEQVLNEHKKSANGVYTHETVLDAMVSYGEILGFMKKSELPKEILELYRVIEKDYKFNILQIKSFTRKREVVYLRNIIAKILSTHGYKDPKIGDYINRDRTMVIKMVKEFEMWVNYDNNKDIYSDLSDKFAAILKNYE
jgi:chromosomal replication initiation ATPase DnaA